MSYSQGPDDIAEDFKVALQELSMNSRYEISNLTMIAKENTEHAFAISESLKLHIKTVGHFSIHSIRCSSFLGAQSSMP